MINYIKKTAASCFFILLIIACADLLPSLPDAKDILAGPLEEITAQQLKDHLIGDQEFGRIFGKEDGLGPLFVSNSCESCHIGDGKGHPLTTLTRFGKYTNGLWDNMRLFGGPQLQNRSLSGYPAETIPADASGVTRLTPPSVTGLGFLEAVTDEVILSRADPGDENGDGISGVPNYIRPPDYFLPTSEHIANGETYIGRFGKKAGAVNLLHQVVNAYLEDMGVTSDFALQDNYNINNGRFTGDDVTDPEVPLSVVNNVVFYIRTLKEPPRRNQNNPDVLEGELIFNQIQCAACHLPSLTTGPSEVAALSYKTIHPYTDLLLHDMGAGLDDGYTEGTAHTSEWRTAPLWGIGVAKDSQGGSMFLMHDGRAPTLEEAILVHGGEAAASREAFNNLSSIEKKMLIKFLESL
jgi:CxxC motif-containing protein (DUF1111 family)